MMLSEAPTVPQFSWPSVDSTRTRMMACAPWPVSTMRTLKSASLTSLTAGKCGSRALRSARSSAPTGPASSATSWRTCVADFDLRQVALRQRASLRPRVRRHAAVARATWNGLAPIFHKPFEEEQEGRVGGFVLVAAEFAGLDFGEKILEARGARVEFEAEFAGLHHDGGAAGHVGDEHARLVADERGVDVFVGAGDLARGVGVDAALVGEGGARRRRAPWVGAEIRQFVHKVREVAQLARGVRRQCSGRPILRARLGRMVVRLALPLRSP